MKDLVSDNPQVFLDFLKKVRVDRGTNLGWVARKLGWSRGAVDKWETGSTRIYFQSFIFYANLLGYEVHLRKKADETETIT